MDLEVEIFDWPDTFHVEAKEPDREYQKIFPEVEPEIYPYLVDIADNVCDCRDYKFNILPYLHDPTHRTECIHLIAAKRYRNLLGTKPKKLPNLKT